MRARKTFRRVFRATSGANISFRDLCGLLRRLGFAERTRGSHHVFFKEGVDELIVLQSKGGQAKPYQTRQVRRIILTYRLEINGDA